MATSHLTLAEHGAYTLLLDEYYGKSQSLPGNVAAIYRICRASTGADRQAIDAVLGEFFVLDCGRYFNRRADEEIEKAAKAIEAARANGINGGRPKKKPKLNPVDNPVETQRVPQSPPQSPPQSQTLPESSPEEAIQTQLLALATTPIKPATLPVLPAKPANKKNGKPKNEESEALKLACRQTWSAYEGAYSKRYGTPPIRDAQVNTHIKRFVERVGMEHAPGIATYYVGSNNAFHVGRSHPVELLQTDAQKLNTEYMTGQRVTQTQARLTDRTASNPFLRILEERKREQGI